MKKILAMVALVLPMMVWGQKSTLNVTLKGMHEGSRFIVNELQGSNVVPVDTLALDAKESLKIKRNGDDVSFFIIAPEGARTPIIHCLMLPKEKVSVVAEYDKIHNYLHVINVKGSDNMALYMDYNNVFYEGLLDDNKRASASQEIETMLRDHNDLLMSAFLITYFENLFEQYAPLYKSVHDALIGRYPTHEFVRHLHERLSNAVLVGMEAPEIVLPDTSGARQIRLSDLRGKVVLIDFWASWCSPCRRENPNVVKMYKKYHDLGFEIFSVSLDDDRDKWLNAIEKDGLIWPYHVSDLLGWRSAAGQKYNIRSIPATVLIDRDGKVLARNLRGTQLENKLKELFGQ